MAKWLTRDEALATLRIRPQTLYAYASRGRVGARPDPANPRRSLYSGEDIDGLIRRRERGRRPDIIAASTIAWGEPIITTAISTVVQERLYYRGRDAVALSAAATLEAVAGLLWETPSEPRFHAGAAAPASWDGAPRARAFAALAAAAAAGRPTFGRVASVLRAEGAALVGCLATAFDAATGGDAPLHLRLAAAWKQDATAATLIRKALVLLADQELTTSVFAARVTASTGAPLGACALSGLAALSGPLHGNAALRVRALFEEVRRAGADATIARHLASGLPLPGFGHRLYPTEGDPRAAALLSAFAPPALFARMIRKVGAATGLHPTVDVALAALATRFNLPEDAPFALFAIGRSVGWLAHSIEQTTTGTLIRPRARYAGPPVGTA